MTRAGTRRRWVCGGFICLAALGCGGDGGSEIGTTGTVPSPPGEIDALTPAEEERVKEILGQPAGSSGVLSIAEDQQEKVQIRVAAIRRIEEARSAEGIALLQDLAQAAAPLPRNSFIADNAVAALARIGTTGSRAALTTLVSTGAPETRLLVVALLAHAGTADDLAVLDAAAASGGPALRARVEEARARISRR